MAVSIGSLILDLRASTDGLSKDAAKAVQKARRMGNDMAKAVAVGASAAVAALAVVVNQASERIDKLAKNADKLGVPIERLRALQEIGEKSGIGIDAVTSAMKNLQNQVFLAAAGSVKAGYGFRALGLDVDAMLKLSPDQQLAKVTDALKGIENQTVKAGIATKIFGEEGAAMLGAFSDGSRGIDEATDRLAALGVTMSRIDAAQVEIANDALSDLKLITEGAGNQLAIAFAPIIKGVAEELKAAAGETNGFRDWIIKLVDTGVTGVGQLANAWRGWHLIIKAGQMAMVGLMGAFELVRKAGEVAMLGLAGAIGEALRGWEMIGVSVSIAFLSLMDSTKGAVQVVIDGILIGINAVIEGVNALASTSFKPLEFSVKDVDFTAKIDAANRKLDELSNTASSASQAFDQSLTEYQAFTAEIANGTDAYTSSIKSLWGETEAILNKPLPSEALDKWIADTRAKTAAAATEIAAAVKPAFAAVDVPLLSEETEKTTRARFSRIRNAIYDDIINPWEDAYNSIQDQIGGLVRSTIEWKDAALEVAATFTTSVIQALVQTAAQWLASQMATMLGVQATQQATQAATTASSLASAASIQAAWIPAAIAASIATMGGAAWAGLGSFVAATALGTAAAVGIGAIGSLASTAITGGQKLAGSRAQGGHVNAGSLYEVNENGMELFRPDVSGEVVPMGDFEKEMQQESSAGMMISLTQNFASGMQRSDLATWADKIRRETTEGIFDAIKRGGAPRRLIRSA